MNIDILTGNNKITVIGSNSKVEETIQVLSQYSDRLSDVEGFDRQLINNVIVKHKLKAAILYNGNEVYNSEAILRNLKLIKNKNDVNRMTKYTYKFLINQCGSIAHHSKEGWISHYPTVKDLKAFFISNEFGNNIYDHIPSYNSSSRLIAMKIFQLFGISYTKLVRGDF